MLSPNASPFVMACLSSNAGANGESTAANTNTTVRNSNRETAR